MKLFFSFFCTVCILLMFLSCAQTARPAEVCGLLSAEDGLVTFRDDAGNTYTLPQNPTKTAVLLSSLAELWRGSGGDICVTVGESVERGFVDVDTPLVDGGAGKQINTELLLAEAPELVICSADIPAQGEAADLLRAAGITAAEFRIAHMSDYLRVYEIFCALNATADTAYKEALSMRAEIDALLASVPVSETPPRILFLRAGTSARATKAKRAQDHFAAAMLSELGCENIAECAEILPDGISMEVVLAENPDAIFVSLMGDEAAAASHFRTLLTSEVWASLDAVKNGRVYILPKDLFQYKPNGRWAEAYRYLYERLYGEEAR